MTSTKTIAYKFLPFLGAELMGGTFVGLTTRKDGSHCAVVLLSERGENLTWDQAMQWAKERGAELPTRPVAALIFANTQTHPPIGWNWTCEKDMELDGFAWDYHLESGNQDTGDCELPRFAYAVLLIPIAG